MFVMGLDIGKIGAMAVVADANGDIFARSFKEYCHQNSAAKPGRHEQAPQEWWASACYVINNCIDVLKQKGFDTKDVISIAVSGTSGTVFLADKKGDPVTSAIIYDDTRADEEAESLNDTAFEYTQKLGTRFHFSYGLPKILWLKNNIPD